MKRTVIVSNRLPIDVDIHNGVIEVKPSVGGLATGLSSIHPKDKSIWIGWVGIPDEEIPNNSVKDQLVDLVISNHCIPIYLSKYEVENYYYGFSNRIIWPLFHYFLQYSVFNKSRWKSYQHVNRYFATEVLNYSEPTDLIWIHDYHLMLLPSLLKEKNPELNIGFFLHIPFPSYEIFRTLPCREEILEGLLGADLIGFHIYDYQQHFMNCVMRLLPVQVDCNQILYKDHITTVNVYPMEIDADKFQKEAKNQTKRRVRKELLLKKDLEEYADNNPGIKYVLSIDRLDYTKGIANRIKAFDYFLKNNPQFIGKVRLIMLAVPSRTDVPQYQNLKRVVDELVGRVNSKYSTTSWSPILYFYRSFSFENLIELYSNCDVALITPVRDGMNLVAKEYIMSRRNKNGVLILSEMTGAANELPEALLINPVSFQQISDALIKALTMPLEEQQERMESMQKRLINNNVSKWAQEFLSDLEDAKNEEQKIIPSAMIASQLQAIVQKYQQSKKRLFLLDYDGTLMDFKDSPDEVIPDKQLLKLLQELTRDEKNIIYIVSGRDHQLLGEWFSFPRINLIAEHGAYKKLAHKDWSAHPGLNNQWKKKVNPLLQKFTDQTPRSFIEQKKYSVAWHYRKSPSLIGELKAKELYKILTRWSHGLDINIFNGDKVIEITNAMINKGNAVSQVLNDGTPDFIMAIGDDVTDEFLFAQLPDHSTSIKVGNAPTIATHRLRDYKETRKLLEILMSNTDIDNHDEPFKPHLMVIPDTLIVQNKKSNFLSFLKIFG